MARIEPELRNRTGWHRLASKTVAELKRWLRMEEKQPKIRTTFFSVAYGPLPGTEWFAPDSPNPRFLWTVERVGHAVGMYAFPRADSEKMYVFFRDNEQNAIELTAFVEMVLTGWFFLVGVRATFEADVDCYGRRESYWKD